ncbi:hypothetical protein EX30DRAFT_393493 [Ascodesmis nigricans]|uniref:Uncharacterized protein n=1 Tax=Ascodesmis nigricans TaxID=341454 RepID=A0A4S2N4A3_9PEZI|nr:hypothetical protein EX30DRAFT_393493 [Ascodesmis nigricans]
MSCLRRCPPASKHPPPRTCTSPVPPEIHEFASMDTSSLQDVLTQTYSRLPHRDLLLLLHLRSLPTHGTPSELAYRLAIHELSHRLDLGQRGVHTPPPTVLSPLPPKPSSPEPHPPPLPPPSPPQSHPLPHLPPEIWSEIFDYVHDWELSTALGITTPHLRPPADWHNKATSTDHAILTNQWPLVASTLPHTLPTATGLRAAIRFSYTTILDHLLHHSNPQVAKRTYALLSSADLSIPILASRDNSTKVLSWWKHTFSVTGFSPEGTPGYYSPEALDEASRKGHLPVLEWWLESSLPLRYGLVMDLASSSSHLHILEWWKNSGLQLEYGKRALTAASNKGLVEVLEWWKSSGLRLVYDKEVLVEATKHNRVEVLEWWKGSGLRVEYSWIDIEGALEDAIGSVEEARCWWEQQGVTWEGRAVREWMEVRVL